MAAYARAPAIVAGDTALPERLRGVRMTANLMRVLRVAPVAGRDLTEADAAPGAPAVALISYRQWQSRFGGRPDAIGAVIRLNNQQATVVGVMPERFGFPEAEDVWMPLSIELPAKRGDGQRVNIIGRLRDDKAVGASRAEFAGLAQQLATEHAENKDVIGEGRSVHRPGDSAGIRTTFFTMMAAVLGVMLIACVNVTNLQLARAAERTKEFAVRSALGSGRWRILRQSLTEGLLLSLAGAAIGVALANIGTGYFMRAIADTQPPFWIDVRVDGTVLLFVTAIIVATALVSSLVPGLRVAGLDVNAVLKDDTRGATGVRLGRVGRWLVVVEVAVSCVLLVVSGLMIRSIVASSRMEFPFATRDVFFGQTRLDERPFPESADVARAVERLDAELERLPGVRRAALASSTPGSSATRTFVVDGAPAAPPESRPRAGRIVATPGYFEVLGAELRAGRLFTAADTAGAEPVAVVDEAFAARHLAPGGALGRRIRFGDEKAPWLTVVGVVNSLVPDTGERRAGVRDRLRAVRAVAGPRLHAAGAHVRRSAGPRAERAGARRARLPGHAGRERELAGRRALAARLGRPALRRFVPDLRRGGARPGGRRPLWRDGVHGAPAHAGDRRAHGARRDAPERAATRRVAGPVARPARHRAGSRARRVPRRLDGGADRTTASHRAIRSCTR